MKSAKFTAVVFALAALAASSLEATQNTVAGNWTLTTENLPLRLVLAQNGLDVSGTLDYPHGAPFQLKGTFSDGTLTFSGDSAGTNFTVHLDSTASLAADGSLVGTLNLRFVELNDEHQVVRTRDQRLPWTATRAAK